MRPARPAGLFSSFKTKRTREKEEAMENKICRANAPRYLEILLIAAPGYPLKHRAAFVSAPLSEKELLQRLINLYGKEVLFVRISINLCAKKASLCHTRSSAEERLGILLSRCPEGKPSLTTLRGLARAFLEEKEQLA